MMTWLKKKQTINKTQNTTWKTENGIQEDKKREYIDGIVFHFHINLLL